MLEFGLYRDCYATAAMRENWSEHATITAWLKVEQVLAQCQAGAGLIPPAAAETIGSLETSQIDMERLSADMMHVGRPIVGLVKQLRTLAGPHADFVHYRSTTQDIMDTALALQMQRGLAQIDASLAEIVRLLDGLIKEHAEIRMIGRTNGQYARPINLASKLAVWRAELRRRRDALTAASERGLNVQIGGPVGDLSAYDGKTGAWIKAAVASALNLNAVEPHWQNARDGIMDIVQALGGLCATLCKIAHNVNLLCSSDIAELAEAHTKGRGASSSMAHKANQRASEFGEAVARLGRQRAEQIGEITLQEHERSGGVWIAEWVVVPEVFLLTSGAMHWLQQLFEGLQVNEGVMTERLNAFQAMIQPAAV